MSFFKVQGKKVTFRQKYVRNLPFHLNPSVVAGGKSSVYRG